MCIITNLFVYAVLYNWNVRLFIWYYLFCKKVEALGFTGENVIAVTTGIESVEWRHRSSSNPENHWANTTNDVECMFSVMRDLIRKILLYEKWGTHGGRSVLSLVNAWTLTWDSTTSLQHMIGFLKGIVYIFIKSHLKELRAAECEEESNWAI